MAKTKTESSELELPCSYGNVSSGKKTCRVAITVPRASLKLPKADATLCDRRLAVTIHANGKDDQAGQGRLNGMEDNLELTEVADCKGFGVHAETISFGLTFNKQELRRVFEKTGVQFADFAGREGKLLIASVSDIPEEEKGNQDEGGEE